MTGIIPIDADNLSNRAADGGIQQPGPHGASTQYSSANSLSAVSSLGRLNSERRQAAPSFIPTPSGSIIDPVPVLKSLNLAQAVLDGLAVLIGFLFLCALAGSLPLAIALMVLGVIS